MRDLRAAGQPPRHPVDEGRARGPRVQVPRARASTRSLRARLPKTAAQREAYIAEVVDAAQGELAERGLAARSTGRAKHLWSIHQKMKTTARDVEQIYDVIAFRVDHRLGARLLRRARRRALELDAGARALQGLHRAAQAEHVPVAAHDGDRPARRAHGDPDPHPGDAPDRRAGHRGALEVQGGHGGGARSRTARRSPGCAS